MTAGSRTVARSVRHMAVVVPARDEQELVGRCLASVLAARRRAVREAGVSVDVLVVLDRCTDATAEIVSGFAGVRVLEVDRGTVGAARAAGVRSALAVGPAAPDETWLACTDADSAVPPRWLLAQARLASVGADLVIGTVRPDFRDLSPAQADAWRATHVPGRPNGHVHGANLGMLAEVYLRAGGFADSAEHEDVDLVARVRALGDVMVVPSAAAEVLTSGRQHGRTSGGYAGYLRTELLARATGLGHGTRTATDHARPALP